MQPDKGLILYIEDHDDSRELVALVLRQVNFDVVTCSTIEAGVRLAQSQTL